VQPLGVLRRAIAFLLGLAVLVPLSSCTSWRVQQIEPSDLIRQKHPSQIRVVEKDGTRLVLKYPNAVDRDLVGSVRGQRVTIAVADVTSIAGRRANWLKTTGLILAFPAALLGVACAMACGYH